MQSYYDLLHARPEATQAEIRHAYRQAVKRTHPDVGGTSAAFADVQAAWRTLGDPSRRAAYDRWQQQPHPSTSTPPGPARPTPAAAPHDDPQAAEPAPNAAAPEGQTAHAERTRPLVRPVRLAVLGPIALSGALTTAILGAVAAPLIAVGAGYVLLTLLAVARRAHPELRQRLSWPGERTYQVLLRGAWALTGGFALLAVMTWALGGSPTAPLIWTVCVATFAIATTVAGQIRAEGI